MLRELCLTEHTAELTYVRELDMWEKRQYRLDPETRWCRITNLHTHGESVQRYDEWQDKIDQLFLHPLKMGAVIAALNDHGDVAKR